VGGGFLVGGVAGERPDLEEGHRGGGAVEVAVGDDRAVEGALGAAVVGVEILDELGAGGAQGEASTSFQPRQLRLAG